VGIREGAIMVEFRQMGKYRTGDHIKFEISGERPGGSEWMWLLVDHCDDEQEIVFGKLDSEPIVATDLTVGQELAISYEKVRDHRRFPDRPKT
jgi:hypothetical protein